MTRKRSVLPTKDDVQTTSRRLLFSSPHLSSTGMPLIYSPQCSSAPPVRSRRLRETDTMCALGHSDLVDANTSSAVIRSVDLPPAPHKRLKKRKSHDVAVGAGATVPLLQSTEQGLTLYQKDFAAHLQELDFGLAPSSPSDSVNVRLSKLSSIASRGFKRLKGSASNSHYALREDVDMFKRLTIIPTEAWQLPHKDPCHHCRAIRFTYEAPAFCCASGKVKIQLPKMPDELWNLYVNDMTPMGVEFRRRCRTYNNSMAFTSIKMTYDEALAKANKGVYTFKVQGIVRHYIQELTPKDGVPRHLQLYFYGTERELENRLSQSGGLDSAIMALLVDILKNNPYHNFFTNLQNMHDLDTYAIVLRANPKLDLRVYNFPVVDHVAAIWNEGMGPSFEQPRDIRVNLRSGGVRYVHYYYGCYDPLQYCLIFPYGEPGWYAGIPKKTQNTNLTFHRANEHIDDFENDVVDPLLHQEVDTLLVAEQNNLCRNFKKSSSVTMREYYCYLFQIRTNDRTNILRTGRVIQQFQIDTYVKIETQRLDFLRHNQSRLEMRAESYQRIVESMVVDGATNARSVGKRVLLPKTFTGGPRDLRCRYMNALALVMKFGRPDFFLTMTCNPKWVEIQAELLSVEESHNRADLYARVFRAKNEELKKELVKDSLFGAVAAYFYVVEFQKRGLPHVHWLIILQPRYKLTSTEAYDRFVSAEIPDPDINPHLHSCVVSHMMHGPCGELNLKNACMKGDKCKNYYPKEFKSITEHRLNSYPDYRRRNDGKKVLVRGKWLDNRWVVPYNAYLLAKFDCHINVQVCTDIKSVKYLYKYVCKGSDQIAYNNVDATSIEPIDEISDFQKSRWLCAPEAMWRIYGFDIFDMCPPVLQLHVHLPGHQQIFFAANQSLLNIVDSDRANRTQLTEFFEMNNKADVAQLNLLYREFVEHFVWNQQSRRWTPRSRLAMIGRLVSVNIMEVERFYLRLLLNHVRAPTSFDYLKTSNGILFSSFREAALDIGLLDSDNDVRHAIQEAAAYQMPFALRKLFATILIFNPPSNPKKLWAEFREALSADILRDYPLDHTEGYNLSLKSIDSFLRMMGHGIDEYSVVDFAVGLTHEEINSREFAAEINMQVDEADLASIGRFNERQLFAYNEIMSSLVAPTGSGFFIDGPAGTGKTFLYKALLATVRSTGGIALAVASSGVAASLLPNGRTAHSRFKIPLNLDESMSCSISKNTAQADLIIAANLILWDEASMANRKAIEALNLLLQDLMENQLLFGGKTLVLGGDFRQTMPIIRRGTREETVGACLVHSSIWPQIRKIHLTQNMRAMEDPIFTEFLLRVGEGTEPNVCGDCISLPDDICLSYHGSNSPLDALVNEIFPSFDAYSSRSLSLINTAILTPKNECMEEINESLIRKFPGNMVEYVVIDYAKEPSQQQYYQDYMNAISVGSLPPHLLKLKVNCPVMLLRNLNPLEGLCNGTRLIVRDLGRHIIGAVIAVGTHAGEYVLIPRIPLELDDKHLCPISFKRLQFPVRLCFAISINKSQGQTLDRVGVYLPHSVFSHGQLYVALSRVRTSSSIKFLIRLLTWIQHVKREMLLAGEMEERLVPMNEILPGIKDWKCRVRVIKKLGAKQASNSPNKFQKLILGDGLGRTLDAVIFHDNIDRFKHVLQEGKVYMVKGAYVSDPKQYKNPLVTCNYQWTFRRDTSVMEEPNDSVPSCGLSFRTTTSCEFHKFISTKTLINTACVVIANQEPRTVAVKGQGKVIREYAVVDKELEPFVVTFWEDSISDEMYDRMEPISKRAPLLLLNFSVVPYYGLSLSSNAQSIVLDDPKDEMLIELERWKHENEDPINILVQSTSFFEKKVMRLPNQPLKMSTVEQILNTQENAYFHVKVKARVENEYQDYFYISCSVCSTKTVAMYGTEFMCYSTPCKNTRVANRSFRFSLVIFDATGQAEVTFMGKEAQKLLGLEPSEFYQKQNEFSTAQSDFLRKRLCNVVLLLKLKSRIFKDAPTFTVDAIEILPDDNGTTPEKTIIQCNTYSEQGQLKSAKRKLIYHGSSDSDSSIQMKIATKDKGKGKMNLESNVEHIKEDTVGYTLEDSDFSDDEKSISEIFGGERKKKFVVQSEDEDSENDSFGYEQESTQKDKHEVIKKIKNTPVSKIKGSVRLDLTQDPANDAHWFSKDGDPSAHIGHISDHVDTPENFRDANSDMPLSLELLKAKKKGKSIETKIQCEVNMKMKDSQVGTLHRSKQNFMAGSPKKTRFPKEKNKQVTKALSAMEERMKSKISKDKEKSLPTIPQTPPLKSRSGRTIKKKLLD